MKKTALLILVFTVFSSLCSCGKAGASAGTTAQTVAETSAETSIEADVQEDLNEPKEYAYSEFLELCQKYSDEVYERAKKLSKIELYGVSAMTQENEDRAMAHAVGVWGKISDDVLKDYDIHKGQKIIVTGVVDHPYKVGGTWSLPYGTVQYVLLKDNTVDSGKTFDFIGCRTDDTEILDIPDGTAVKICGTFAKYDLNDFNFLFDCEVLEIIE